jgi:hypothetical protein
MADYETFPIWRSDSPDPANIDPASLPISPALAKDLVDWADMYDATLNRSDPIASGFPNAAAESEFYARGEQLARRLAAELAPAYAVEYFDGRNGQTIVVA